MGPAVLLLLASLTPGAPQAAETTSVNVDLPQRVSAAEIATWIQQLGSPSFRTRQSATRALAQAGSAAVAALEAALQSPDAEVSRRAVGILVELCLDAHPETARSARAVLYAHADREEPPYAPSVAAGLRRLEERAARELQRLGADLQLRDGNCRVTFNDQWEGGDAGLLHLSHLRNLTHVTFWNTELTPESLAFIAGHDQLEYLVFYNVSLRDESLVHLRNLKQLKSLSLVNAQISSDGLEHLTELTKLASLNLHNAASVGDEGMVALSRMAALEGLELSGTAVTDRGLAHLRPLKKLRSLNLNRTAVSAAGLANLELASLRQLYLNGTEVGDDSLAFLQRVSADLTYLDLGHTRVTDVGIEAIARLEDLWYLDLSGTYVSDEGLRHLGRLKQLRTLKLASTRVRGFGLQHLRQNKFYELVLTNTLLDTSGLTHLKGMTVNVLWLDRTKITGEGLEMLAWISELERLYLSGTSIGDEDMKHFHQGYFTKLRSLHLRQTRVTYRAVNTLKSIMPRCDIQL